MKTGYPYFSDLTAPSLHLCRVATIELVNGTTYYLTDTDFDFLYEGHVWRSNYGFNGSAIQLALGVSGQTQQIDIAVAPAGDANGIQYSNIYHGDLNGASVTVYYFDYIGGFAHNNNKLPLYCGFVTEATFGDTGLVSLQIQSTLSQVLPLCGDKYGATCRYDFGDANCGVDLSDKVDRPQVYSVIDAQTIKCQLTEASPDGYYNNGFAFWQTGPLANVGIEIATDSIDTDGRTFITLKVPMPDVPLSSTANPAADPDMRKVTLYPGCDKTITGGCTYWNNVLRFGGEPFVPNQTVVSSSPPPASTPVATVVTPVAATTTPASTFTAGPYGVSLAEADGSTSSDTTPAAGTSTNVLMASINPGFSVS